MITSEDLRQASKGLSIIENTPTTDHLNRLKSTEPFSQRLNDWIERWFNKHQQFFKFTDEDDFNPEDIEGTFKSHYSRWCTQQVIHIWKGESDHSIFGSPQMNYKFRAWHDFIHMTYELGYDYMSEALVGDLQKKMLPEDWYFEHELLHVEITGQALYHKFNNSFVEDQRKFTLIYLQDPAAALKL